MDNEKKNTESIDDILNDFSRQKQEHIERFGELAPPERSERQKEKKTLPEKPKDEKKAEKKKAKKEKSKDKKKPKVKDIADFIGCKEEEVLEALEASYGYQPVSLDTPVNSDSEDSEITLIDRLGEYEDSFINIEYKDFVDKFVGKLNELEVKIFKGRFFEEKTQSALANELNISQMTISRIERKIVEKLRKEYEK